MTPLAPRRLVLVRHAKSDQHPPEGVVDHDRPLTARGRRDAPALGRWLAATVGTPELVLCSSAARVLETWHLAAPALATAATATVMPELYAASPGTVLSLVRRVGADVRTVLVLGHEPVQSTLTQALAGPGSNLAALTGLAAGFSTSAVAVLETDEPWDALQPHGARLTHFAVPRG